MQKMKISDTNNCRSCGEIDYSEHFFFHCLDVKNIWKEIEDMILYRTGQQVKLTMIEVMLGIINHKKISKTDLKWVNHIILVGKMVISKYKYGPMKLPLEILSKELDLRKLK